MLVGTLYLLSQYRWKEFMKCVRRVKSCIGSGVFLCVSNVTNKVVRITLLAVNFMHAV